MKAIWLEFPFEIQGAAINMAVDERLLQTAHQIGRPVLRCYGWSDPAATFGYSQRYEEARSQCPAVKAWIRRCTGGGVVDHTSDWTYSVVCPPQHEWYALNAAESYQTMHGWINEAFQKLGLDTSLKLEVKPNRTAQCFVGAERHDLIWKSTKIAGAAQRRTCQGLLIQGSIQHPDLPHPQRNAWFQGMRDVAAERWSVQWQPYEPTKSFWSSVLKFSRKKYESDSYNQKR